MDTNCKTLVGIYLHTRENSELAARPMQKCMKQKYLQVIVRLSIVHCPIPSDKNTHDAIKGANILFSNHSDNRQEWSSLALVYVSW